MPGSLGTSVHIVSLGLPIHPSTGSPLALVSAEQTAAPSPGWCPRPASGRAVFSPVWVTAAPCQLLCCSVSSSLGWIGQSGTFLGGLVLEPLHSLLRPRLFKGRGYKVFIVVPQHSVRAWACCVDDREGEVMTKQANRIYLKCMKNDVRNTCSS